MLARITSASLLGLEVLPVEVEVDVYPSQLEKSSFVIVGLPDAAVKESKDRVSTAIRNTGFNPGLVICTVNLAPGDVKKEGPMYDLPIAIGFLRALEIFVPIVDLQDYCIVGELALSGETRSIQGALALALFAKKQGKKGILLPAANATEASCLPGIDVIPIHHLKEAIQFFINPSSISPLKTEIEQSLFTEQKAIVDFADIKGQAHVKRAIEIAAAGGHNILLSGPPGSGKTMIAKAMNGIIPELTIEEALEATKIHSVAGLLKDGTHIITKRPFRSPHHTVSYAGLIGGGAYPRPGEVSLAHTGILFLDELPEFSRLVLEVLRQPLEDRYVTISRANGNFTFPTNFICVAAMNPCPCGNLGHPTKACKDSPLQIERYRSKISGPLLDRIDMLIEVPSIPFEELSSKQEQETSEEVRKRVKKSRLKQRERFKKAKTNSMMDNQDLKKYATLDLESEKFLQTIVDKFSLSARAYHRLLKVARTIADLEDKENVEIEHLMEAAQFRSMQF